MPVTTSELSGFPYAAIRFDTHGGPADPAEAEALLALVADTSVTELLVLAHGWNNDLDAARRLYEHVAASLAAVRDAVPGLAGRRVALAGILWPSKKFAESDLVPGGAAALGGVSATEIRARLAELRGVFTKEDADAELTAAAELADKLDSGSARREFAERIRSVLPAEARDADDGSDRLFSTDGGTLMDRLGIPATLVPPHRDTGSAGGPGHGGLDHGGAGHGGAGHGGAAGLGRILGGVRGSALNLLNYATYYEMKNRAGVVGRRGVAALLQRVHERRSDLGVHLVGHSFGGRLAAATATAVTTPVASLSLLQAAFSHYGFAHAWEPGEDGVFRSALTAGRVSGPVLVTHTANDTAVGVAYALASRIGGQVAAAVGDRNDRYGGIGRNGAQKTPEAVGTTLLDVGGAYELESARVHNLLADTFVKSHSDVTGRQVAYAILSAIAAG